MFTRDRHLRIIISLCFCILICTVAYIYLDMSYSDKSFTIIVLPDTQKYSESYPEIFTNQTQWIVENKNKLNIVFVAHEGDIVQDYNNTTQWQRANTSMSILDGIVPYSVLPGNHNMNLTTGASALYNSTFPASRFSSYEWYGGSFSPANRNSYQLINVSGGNYIILNLEYCPSNEILNWANQTLETYKDRKAIIVTHMYLNLWGGLFDKNFCRRQKEAGCENCGKEIYEKLVVPNTNIIMILNGHLHGEALNTTRIDGRLVHQIVANYQDRPNGGNGYLRILRFVPTENKVYVKTYSPPLNTYETDENSQFILNIEV